MILGYWISLDLLPDWPQVQLHILRGFDLVVGKMLIINGCCLYSNIQSLIFICKMNLCCYHLKFCHMLTTFHGNSWYDCLYCIPSNEENASLKSFYVTSPSWEVWELIFFFVTFSFHCYLVKQSLTSIDFFVIFS